MDEGGRSGTVIDWSRFRNLWERQADTDGGSPVRAVTLWVAVALWLLALLVVFLTWKGTADRPLVAEQVPYLVSGGLTVLVLTAVGCSVFLYGVLAAPPEERAGELAAPASDTEHTAPVRPLRQA